MESGQPPFECKRCNQCCRGKGGITLAPEQVGASAACLQMEAKEFIERFLSWDGTAYQVGVDEEGCCILLGPEGCTIHQAKPDICARWPFFDALLNDPDSFEEAKSACPGINPAATHAEFVAHAAAQKSAGPKED